MLQPPMNADTFTLRQRVYPHLRPNRMIGQYGIWVRHAAHNKSRMERAPRGRAGLLVANIHTPAHAIRVVARGAVRRIFVHEQHATRL